MLQFNTPEAPALAFQFVGGFDARGRHGAEARADRHLDFPPSLEILEKYEYTI